MSKRILASLLSGLSMQFEDVTAAGVRGAVEIARDAFNEQYTETEKRRAAERTSLRRAAFCCQKVFRSPCAPSSGRAQSGCQTGGCGRSSQ